MSPVKGLPPSEPPASFVFWIFLCILIDFNIFFRSIPRKLSWPPLDRARRCDSFASNENFVAQIKTPFRACHLKSPYDIFFHLTYILLPNYSYFRQSVANCRLPVSELSRAQHMGNQDSENEWLPNGDKLDSKSERGRKTLWTGLKLVPACTLETSNSKPPQNSSVSKLSDLSEWLWKIKIAWRIENAFQNEWCHY